MVWTAPMTAIPGDVFTAAQFNTHLRDNLNYLKTQTDTNASSIVSLTSSVNTGATNITNLTNWTRRGSVSVSFASADSNTSSVNFGFTFPGIPTVMTNIHTGAGSAARWGSRAISTTTTGFSLLVFAPTASASIWSGIEVTWIAHYRA